MNNTQKLKAFGVHLENFKHPIIKGIVKNIIINTPTFFFGASTSSTGKYHPLATNGVMGLVKHSVAVMLTAQDMFRNDTIMSVFGLSELSELDKEIILAACLLHDNAKYGTDDNVYSDKKLYTNNEHPRLVSQIAENAGLYNDDMVKEVKLYLNRILDLIETHMGQWTNTDSKYSNPPVINLQPLEAPKTGPQAFVHMCDYIASRKTMDIISEMRLSEDIDKKTLDWFEFQNS